MIAVSCCPSDDDGQAADPAIAGKLMAKTDIEKKTIINCDFIVLYDKFITQQFSCQYCCNYFSRS